MDLSDLIKESERLRPQIADELDPTLQREMKKTYRHFQKQIRAGTKHRHPWFGLKVNLVFLVVVFVGLFYICIRFEMAYGWGYTTSGAIMAAVALVLLTAMIFLLMKIFSPDNYTQIVQICFDSLHRLRGAGASKTKSLPPQQSEKKTPPQLTSATPSGDAPKVSFDNPLSPQISASEESSSEDS